MTILNRKDGLKDFQYRPIISIIMPVYNSKETWLRYAIESVINQSYPYWELCIADDCSPNEDVRTILKEYAEKDKRIKIIFLEENQGISGATNNAFELASGEFVGLLDHDDELDSSCLYEVVKLLNENPELDFIYTDEDKIAYDGRYVEPFFKPDFSPDLLMAMNYINHFSVFRKCIITKVGGWRKNYEGSQDYDLVLRVTEVTNKVAHIRKILYHWRKVPGSTADKINAKEYALISAKRALEDSLKRRGIDGNVDMIHPGIYRVRYKIVGNPLVSIIIPTKDKVDLLKKCISSIYEKSTYNNFEIIVINNNSVENETFLYFKELQKIDKIHIVDLPIEFNYSKLNNLAVHKANGDYLLFLNNDIEVIANNWIEELLGYAQRSHVGAVGAKLIYPNNTIQHAGVVIGERIAWHAFYGYPSESPFIDMLYVARNCSAVTGACLMVSKKIFEEIDGFDEELSVVYNDVDLCLKILEKGYYNVWNPNALLYHYESATRGKDHPKNNVDYFFEKWSKLLKKGDPFDIIERINKDRIQHSLEKNTQGNDRHIYIWGAGSSGYRMYSVINQLGFKIKGFIDSDPNKWNKVIFNLPIFSPVLLESTKLKPYVVIASMYSDEIKTELVKMGYEQEKDFWVDH